MAITDLNEQENLIGKSFLFLSDVASSSNPLYDFSKSRYTGSFNKKCRYQFCKSDSFSRLLWLSGVTSVTQKAFFFPHRFLLSTASVLLVPTQQVLCKYTELDPVSRETWLSFWEFKRHKMSCFVFAFNVFILSQCIC